MRCPQLKIDPASAVFRPNLPTGTISPGIYPYIGSSVHADQLASIVSTYGGAVAPGKRGAQLAAKVSGVLVDPARYDARPEAAPDTLFDCDEWLIRQQAAGAPLVLADASRIRNRDRSALRKALARWEKLDQPTVVVLPIENWWLRNGLSILTEEVRAAGRPVAIVLLHPYNGLDAVGAIAGLLTLIGAVSPLPVILLRCDISAVGAVAYGASAGYVGWSATTRHGPLPMGRREERGAVVDLDRDDSPAVFVPALHGYYKASKLPAFARGAGQRSCAAMIRCAKGKACCESPGLVRLTFRLPGCLRITTTWLAQSSSRAAFCPPMYRGTLGGKPARTGQT